MMCILWCWSVWKNLCDESSGEGGQWVSEWGSFLRRIQRSTRMSESDFSSWEKKTFENYERENIIMKNYYIWYYNNIRKNDFIYMCHIIIMRVRKGFILNQIRVNNLPRNLPPGSPRVRGNLKVIGVTN